MKMHKYAFSMDRPSSDLGYPEGKGRRSFMIQKRTPDLPEDWVLLGRLG